MDYKVTTKNELETIELAQNIESEKFPNMVICLNGELGSGKTIFAKGFGNAMGINDEITSPTFSIIKEYEGELPFFHMDVYRLDEKSTGFDLKDYLKKGGIVIIEWGDSIKDELPSERLDINIKIVGENKRIFILKPKGEKYIDLCEAVL